MTRRTLTFLLVAAATLVAPASASALPAGFSTSTLASGLNDPVAVAFAPAADGRMFIAEHPGRVLVRQKDGTMAAAPLVDWRDKVNAYQDRGLIGIETDVDFASNGYLYLLFNADNDATDDPGYHSARLVRLTVGPDNSVIAEKSLLGGDADKGECPTGDGNHTTVADAKHDCIPAWATVHTVGTIASDPRDGTLWLGSGDANPVEFTNANRPGRMVTYNEESFAGKVMHIDREGKGLADHPFCPGVTDLDRTCTKIYAKGFRNPFRFTVPKQPGRGPIVADVGDLQREELNASVVAGGNYGWPCWEGSDVRPRYYNGYSPCAGYVDNRGGGTVYPKNVISPDFQYARVGVDASIVAGPVYDGLSYPAAYRGRLFFGDYAQGWIRTFAPSTAAGAPGGFAITPQSILNFTEPNSSELFTELPAFTQLEAAPNGDLVAVQFVSISDTGDMGPGRVIRYEYAAGNGAPKAVARVAAEEVDAGEAAAFDGTDSTDPDGDVLTYAWDFDDDGTTDSTDPKPSHTFATAGAREVTLTVTDAGGKSDTATVTVLVGLRRPEVEITTPVPDSLYDGGATVSFAGTATDAEDGALAADRLTWDVQLIHGAHLHPIVQLPGVAGGSFSAWQDHGVNSHYRVKLTATDSTGLTQSKTITIYPRPATVKLASDPAGAPLVFADEAVTAGSIPSAVGLKATLSAAATFASGGKTWRFTSWSDGVTTAGRDVEVPVGGLDLVARYAADPDYPVDPVVPDPPALTPEPPVTLPATPPAGTPPAAGAGATPVPPKVDPPKTTKPKLAIASPWTSRKPAWKVDGRLTGVTPRPTVQVALAKPAGTRCRWWSAPVGRYGKPRSCTEPSWMSARIEGAPGAWRFIATLRGEAPRSAARIEARARVNGRTVTKTTRRIGASK